MNNITSFMGIFVLLGLAWLISRNRRNVNWRVIAWGVGLQMLFGFFVFRMNTGAKIFLMLNDLVVAVVKSASIGTEFVFGRLALPPGNPDSLGVILACQVFPAIIFFSALMAVLYYLKVMPVIVKAFARLFTKLMRISGAESLCAASNIFVGIESVLSVKPHLEKMTKSEFCTILAAGMATVASSVMGAYVGMLESEFPNIAAHLVSASILSAPAAMVMAKILVPEDEEPVTLGLNVEVDYKRESGLFEAIVSGANDGVKLVFGIVGLLIAVLGMVGILNALLGAAGSKVAQLSGAEMNWSLEGLLGLIFCPFAIIIGIPVQDALLAGRIMGERVIMTEMVSYVHLGEVMGQLDPRSVVMITYALCGFAHVASMALFVGGVSAVVPSRARDVARVGPRALLAATLACLMTACVAGMYPVGKSILLGH